MRHFLSVLIAFLPSLAFAQLPQPKGELPKVYLLGDSIRMGYAPLVAKKLDGIAEVVSPKDNGADTANTLKSLDKWLEAGKPAVVHFNCGLHDLKFDKKTTSAYQVSPDDYEKNLKLIVERLRRKRRTSFSRTPRRSSTIGTRRARPTSTASTRT